MVAAVLARTAGWRNVSGVTSTVSDRHAAQTVLDLVPAELRGVRLYPVGRLDKDSEGLILLTDDGDWAQHLLHPRYGVEREYAIGLHRPLDAAQSEQLGEGIELTGPGNVICHNFVKGFRDAISTLEDSGARNQYSIDIYNNDITEMGDDQYIVQYDDGESAWKSVYELQPEGCATMGMKGGAFTVGMRVMGQWTNGSWYPASNELVYCGSSSGLVTKRWNCFLSVA